MHFLDGSQCDETYFRTDLSVIMRLGMAHGDGGRSTSLICDRGVSAWTRPMDYEIDDSWILDLGIRGVCHAKYAAISIRHSDHSASADYVQYRSLGLERRQVLAAGYGPCRFPECDAGYVRRRETSGAGGVMGDGSMDGSWEGLFSVATFCWTRTVCALTSSPLTAVVVAGARYCKESRWYRVRSAV